MNSLHASIKLVSDFIWNGFLLYTLVGTGIFLTIRMKFPQFRYLKESIYLSFIKPFKTKRQPGEVSAFQALAVSIAAQVGTGNVAGVASAIVAGGPGAIFWMWVSAFFGCGTIFSEAILAQVYKEEINGVTIGGPAFYISKGMAEKKVPKPLIRFLTVFFTIAIILALGLIGNMVQANSIAMAFNQTFKFPSLFVGIVTAIIAYLVFAGGISRIASFAEKVVPIMAIVYILSSVFMLISRNDMIIPAIQSIFVGALKPEALGGGLVGITVKESMRYGVARGLFSNEAGMGSTPHAHATAKVDHPVEQGMTAFIGVIVDTFIICSTTAIMILITDANQYGLEAGAITTKAFEIGLGSIGPFLLTICLCFFAFTTIIGWYYFGETNVKYLFGQKGVPIYQVLVALFIILGSINQVAIVWDLADLFNGIMVLPNLISLWVLTDVVSKKVLEYDQIKK